MKKISYIFTILLSIILFISHVNAECTSEELNELKNKADKIRVTYEHLGAVDIGDGDVTYSLFNVNIKNIPVDFYVKYNDDKLLPENNLISKQMTFGKKEIIIYSNNCEEKLKTINFKLPRFNMYSLNPLCEGIDGDDFALCGKYYDYDVSYDNFVKRVTNYRNTHDASKNEETINEKSLLDEVLNIIKDNYLYIGIAFGIIMVVILLILLIKKRKKRGVLE